MTDEVMDLHAKAKDAARATLELALAAGLKEVAVLGIHEDGSIFSEVTEMDPYRLNWLLDEYKWTLMRAYYADQADKNGA